MDFALWFQATPITLQTYVNLPPFSPRNNGQPRAKRIGLSKPILQQWATAGNRGWRIVALERRLRDRAPSVTLSKTPAFAGMTPVHGWAVTSEEIERLTGRDLGPAGFASMCNAISWSSIKKRLTSLPPFTERAQVAGAGTGVLCAVEQGQRREEQ
jgi:hypothetical protein